MFVVNNRNARKKCEICSKLTIKTTERRQWRRPGVFIVNFEHISHFFLALLLLTLKKYMLAGIFSSVFLRQKYHTNLLDYIYCVKYKPLLLVFIYVHVSCLLLCLIMKTERITTYIKLHKVTLSWTLINQFESSWSGALFGRLNEVINLLEQHHQTVS